MPELADHAAFAPPTLDPAPKILIVAAPFYRAIADLLIQGAEAALAGQAAEIDHVEVPGALEIGPAIAAASADKRFDGFVALGCVIRGATTHYETVCAESARALTDLSVWGGLAIGNGVLTVETLAQAEERADPARQDKGGGAAVAALSLIGVRRRFGPDARRGAVGFLRGRADQSDGA